MKINMCTQLGMPNQGTPAQLGYFKHQNYISIQGSQFLKKSGKICSFSSISGKVWKGLEYRTTGTIHILFQDFKYVCVAKIRMKVLLWKVQFENQKKSKDLEKSLLENQS